MRTAPAYEYEEAERTSNGAELNLGMGTLIGIFFGLALVCGVFFGFGYTLGHRPSSAPSSSSQTSDPSASVKATLVAPKPSAQSASQPSEAPRVVLSATPPEIAQPASTAIGEVRPVQEKSSTAHLRMPAPASTTLAAQTAPGPTGTIMVQIAAVKNHNDAQALANALRKNGFSPTIRTEQQDKLLHVQVGPFSNREEAKAMRQKLSSAGYNAFIK